MVFPWSMFGYFILGGLGAFAFLILLLLFDKDVEILLNRRIDSVKIMGTIYILLGGVLAIVANVAAYPDFGPNQFMVAFVTGLGWPAIASGIGAGKRVGEINEMRKEVEKDLKLFEELKRRRKAQMDDYYRRVLEQTGGL